MARPCREKARLLGGSLGGGGFLATALAGCLASLSALGGLCGLALPSGFRNDGMPFGVTLIGGAFDEGALLRVGALWQELTALPLGKTASVLPPAEACRFLVDLANLRGGPDNITAIVVRVGAPPTADAEVALLPRPRKPLLERARWLLTLVGGPRRTAADPPPAKTHRRRACKIEWPVLDKLIRGLRSLRKRARENNRAVDWNLCQEHQALADKVLASNDLPGAFREYCRAMLLLMPLFHPPE